MIVTGTSRGIGRSLAHYYVEKGFQVIGCSRTLPDFQFSNYHHYCLDVSDEAAVKEMFMDIGRNWQRLDVLINNAGVQAVNYVLLTPLSTVQKVFNTNMAGTFLFCREAVKLMKRNVFGRIINLSTVAVPLCSTGSAIYGASKSAIEQFSRVLANEVAADGITVNTVGLSITRNSGMADKLSEKAVSEALSNLVFKSPLDMEDVVNALDFFILETSRMITRQTLYLGGI